MFSLNMRGSSAGRAVAQTSRRLMLASFLELAIILASPHAVAQDTSRQLNTVNLYSGLPPSFQAIRQFHQFTQYLVDATPGRPFIVKLAEPFPSASSFDNLSSGKLQMMWIASAAFVNKEYAFTLLSHPPFISLDRYLQWRAQPATVKAIDALYAKYEMKALPCAVIDGNPDFVLRRVPDAEYRLKGARVGMNGPMREIYAATGMTPIALPVSELARSMETGTLDGVHTFSPHESIELRLYDFTKAVIYPSAVRGFTVTELMMNLAFWNGLDARDRTAIESVCRRMVAESITSSRKLADDAIERYRKAGTVVMPLPEPDVQLIRQKWDEVAAKRAAFEPAFERLYNSLYAK